MDALDRKSFAGLAQLLVVLGALLFLPAWTLAWPEAWVFLAVFGACTLAVTLYLMRHDRALLARRVAAGPTNETRGPQKVVQAIASLAFVSLFVLSALDHRFGWTPRLPLALEALGDVVVAGGLGFVFLVFRANSFTSATIEVASEQRVISTGPYAWVRHPMYLGALFMLAGIPLALGALAGLLAVIPLKLAIVWRLLDEEKMLAASLPGYDAYRAKVRARLVPGVW